MRPLTGQDIRKMWLAFFNGKMHQTIPGASLIPYNDPTLLWINSGVAAIKRYFDGSEIPQHKRLTNVQKSIRTNDIENVGYTARHHTFFEMLGNFSIGDYFRKEAIEWAYELLTAPQLFALDKNRIYITYSPTDTLTRDYWIKCGIASDHLIPLEGNYWEIGEGPCGPNTEIFFDRGEKYDPKKQGVELLKQEINNDRYIEIWNIVFSQYNAVTGVPRAKYKELPSKNIDTGAGLERLACIMQETPTNFETDLFFPIIQATEKMAKVGYAASEFRPYRVIADHIRTVTFALSDGALFSNEGRGYVLRRILRRALRYGRKIGIYEPFLHHLVPVVAKMMNDFYPYLTPAVQRVSKMVQAEEEKFIAALTTGESLLKKLIEEQKKITNDDAFKLYDTYGFPIELTIEMAAEQGIQIDRKAFDALMEQQRERARQARVNVGSMQKQSADLLAFKTPSEFTYDPASLTSKVIGLFVDGKKVNEIKEEGVVVFEKTPFYAESGGQVADSGFWENPKSRVEVVDVQKAPNKQHLHIVKVLYGSIKIGDTLTGTIDVEKRHFTMRNHSSVHLLQYALRKVLGPHILQQGSFVSDEYSRFDFSHNAKVTTEQLAQIEDIVNQEIVAAHESTIELLPVEQAKKTGAIAPFEEKYGDIVRVITFGPNSKEFCGGTHVSNTGQIGVYAIVSEESIASGTRRITSVTSQRAYRLLKQREQMLGQVAQSLGAASYAEIRDRLTSMVSEKETLKVTLATVSERLADIKAKELQASVLKLPNQKTLLTAFVGDMSREMLNKLADRLKKDVQVLVLVSQEGTGYPLLVAVQNAAVSKTISAGLLLKDLAKALDGSGGGRPDIAFGAGKNIASLDAQFKLIKSIVSHG